MTYVTSDITATVWQVRTEIPVTAPHDGTVTEIRVAPEDRVAEGDVVVVLERS